MKVNILKVAAIVLLIMGGIISSCKKPNENNSLSKELIASNLSKKGSSALELLIGEWDCIKFAYTADGQTISDVTALSKGWIAMRNDAPFCEKLNNEYLFFNYINEYYCNYSISANLIAISLICQPTYAGILPEEEDIANALENAYSFTIKDRELMIYFTGTEDVNLLILEKR